MNCKECEHSNKKEKLVRIRANPLKYRDKTHWEKRTYYECALNSCIIKEV